ncbi:hypothetical protein O3M35_008078 [Rhynocoris fuscipes]|uniref:Glycoside hydrolase family 38 central domain-containing protein n=1 Tax=Rhynocoris fuscipes TaxID=488301 RepID=A0AAW1D8L8_9HEMI
MLTMGSDLNYQQAEKNFANLDKLIRYLNRLYRNQLYVFYSTPSCYLNAVNEAKIEMPSKADDFFPYASKQNEYWAGYFTSRPTLKRFERIGNNFLQVGKQILAMANSPLSLDISRAKEAMGVMQHHDAITGTSREYVAHDYARLLTNALEKVMQASSKALNTLVRAPYQPVREPEFQSCFLLNISTCHMTEDVQSFVVTVYNPLSRNVNKLVRLPISSTQLSWIVHGPEDENLPVQMVPIPDFLFYIPGRRLVETVEIVFIAENLPPLGYKSYYVESSNTENENFFRSKLVNVNENNISVGYNNGIMVTIDQNGKIDSIKTKGAAKETPFTQEFAYYHGANQPEEFQVNKQSWSGAYIFRPTGTAVTVTDQPKTTIVQGPIVTEIQQTISSWINQVIRLLNGADYVEFQWTVGPIPFKHEKNGKEVITRYKIPTLKNGGVFYTDSNGREMIRRNLQRWSVDVTEPIPGNYYPVTTRINIKDTEDPTKSLTVVTDRSEGGTSLEDGTIELMLHRRLKLDDRKGVDQPLDEMAFDQPLVAVGSHYISLEPSHKTTLLNQEKVLDAWIFISPANGVSYDQWKTYYLMEVSINLSSQKRS